MSVRLEKIPSTPQQEQLKEKLKRCITGVYIPEGVKDENIIAGKRYEGQFKGERYIGPQERGPEYLETIEYFCYWRGEGSVVDRETGESRSFRFQTNYFYYNLDHPKSAISLEEAITRVRYRYSPDPKIPWVDEDAPTKARDILLGRLLDNIKEMESLPEGHFRKREILHLESLSLTFKELVEQGLVFDEKGQRHLSL